MARLIRIPEVLRLTGISKATIYRWIGRGTFPPPVNPGGSRMISWKSDTIEEWIESRETQKSA